MIIGRGWDQWFHRLTAQFQEFIDNSSARISYWDVDEGPRCDLRRNEVLKKLELVCSTGCVVGLAVFLPTANRLPPTSVDLETQRFVSSSQQNWRLATCVAAVRHGRPGAPVFVSGRASLTELNTSHLRDVLPCVSLRPPSSFAPPTWLFLDGAQQRAIAAQGDGPPAFCAQFLITFHSNLPQAKRFRFPPIAFHQLLVLGVDVSGTDDVPPVSLDCADYAAPWRTVQRWFSDAILGALPAV